MFESVQHRFTRLFSELRAMSYPMKLDWKPYDYGPWKKGEID